MSVFRELLIGCGRSRIKKLQSVDGNPEWRGLVTLDNNEDVNPDLWCHIPNHGLHWMIGSRNQTLSDVLILEQVLIRDEAGCYLRDSSFDEIHAYEVLEHLGSQGDYNAFFTHFTELWRLLKPNGHLYATVPSRFSPWLWGDPSHRRAILPQTLTFLDQDQYRRQCDGDSPTAMSDFRYLYKADFVVVNTFDNRETFAFILRAIKPSRVQQ